MGGVLFQKGWEQNLIVSNKLIFFHSVILLIINGSLLTLAIATSEVIFIYITEVIYICKKA